MAGSLEPIQELCPDLPPVWPCFWASKHRHRLTDDKRQTIGNHAPLSFKSQYWPQVCDALEPPRPQLCPSRRPWISLMAMEPKARSRYSPRALEKQVINWKERDSLIKEWRLHTTYMYFRVLSSRCSLLSTMYYKLVYDFLFIS